MEDNMDKLQDILARRAAAKGISVAELIEQYRLAIRATANTTRVQLSILVAEDEFTLLALLHLAFDGPDRACFVSRVADIQSACATEEFDVLFTDGHLLDGSVLPILAELRTAHPNMHIVVATGDVELRDAAIALGCGVIDKPYTPRQLKTMYLEWQAQLLASQYKKA
jgi:DNA-binding NtrC family response regulator